MEEVWLDDWLIQKVDVWDAAAFTPEQLHLTIDRQAMQQLEAKRQEALAKGILQAAEDDWVKATLRPQGEDEKPVSLRLKGDWLDHLRGDKWSYRIKMQGTGSWKGMVTFSLHTPKARYFLHEWLLHQFWESQDILTTRYDFVELYVNGESKGIYAYEEHFEKQLVESRSRREGPIVKFSEEGFWAGMARQLGHHGFIVSNAGLSAQQLANAPVTAFNETDYVQNTALAPLYRQARLLMEQYRQGQTPASDIFDLPRLARYYAGCDMLNGYHGLVWHNQRFYYNPINGRLEPVGFDGFADRPAKRYHFLAEGSLHRESMESTSLPAFLLRDTAFIREYLHTLEQLTRPEVWDDFIRTHEEAWTARLQWLQMEFPEYQPNINELAEEVAFVRSHLLPYGETSLRSWRADEGSVWLENTHTLPLLITGYSTSSQYVGKVLPRPLWLPAGPVRGLYEKTQQEDTATWLRGIDFWDQQALLFQDIPPRVRLPLPANARYIFFRIPGWDTVMHAPVSRMDAPEGLADVQRFRQASRAQHFPTLQWDEATSTITIPAGTHTFTQDLVVPPAWHLHIAPGAQIALNNRSAIISYGAVWAVGLADQPIRIFSDDNSGQGLHVLEATAASALAFVTCQGLRNLHKADWQLTGAVTFYASAVKMTDCVFMDNQSEDALNLVRCTFEMERCRIQRTSSDGLDTDFCKGSIAHSWFANTTNDGIDCSGSIITISDCHTERNGDKGISVGEASDVTIRNVSITGCPIGVASKDQSVVHARQLSLSHCEQGLVAYQKKPEFGPATLLVKGLTTENVTRLYQIAPGSRLLLEDE
ncbi:MAG: CotH kinase family protein [Saprospiraceae bacterium]